jgi:hypothetical protein
MGFPPALKRTLAIAVLAPALSLAPGIEASHGLGAVPVQAGATDPQMGLTPRERADVLKGGIILRDMPTPGRPGKTFEALGILPGGVDEAYAIITDFRRYPEFMPRVERVAVKDESETVSIVEVRLAFPFGQSKQYRLKYLSSRTAEGFEVSWEKLAWPGLTPDQTVNDTSGRWLVRRFEAGGVLASYRVYLDTGPVPLGLTGIAQALGKRSLADVIERTRRRIRELFRPDKR